MSVIDFIEKLQQKPRYIRVQIMWLGVVLSAAVIFVFWLWSLSSLLARGAQSNQAVNQGLDDLSRAGEQVPGLWQSLSAGIGNVINTAKEEIKSEPSFTPIISSEAQTEKLPIE